MAVMRPVNDCSGNASTVAVTVWPTRNEAGLDAGNRQPQPQRVDLEQRDDGASRAATYSPSETRRWLMKPENGATTATSATALSASASCARACGERGARGVDVLHRGLGAACVPDRRRCSRRRRFQQRRVALGRRLRQRVLRFGELEVGLGAADGRPRFVEAQSGVDALQADEHGALLDELAHVDRRGDDAAGGIRGDVGRFVGLEAAGGFERHRPVLRLRRAATVTATAAGGLRRRSVAAVGRTRRPRTSAASSAARGARRLRVTSAPPRLRQLSVGRLERRRRRPASVNATPSSITSAVLTAGQGVLNRCRCRTW